MVAVGQPAKASCLRCRTGTLLFAKKPSYLVGMNWKKVREFEEIIYEKCDGLPR